MRDYTLRAVELQLAAMNSSPYEIGVLQRERMTLRTWDSADILKSLRWLKSRNAEGAAVYIRPSGEHRLNLIDDLTAGMVIEMKRTGFEPLLVVETSPNNFQAWVDHGRILSRELSTCAARDLAKRFAGDMGSADWRHFGRLGGFRNWKEKYRGPDGRFPFAKIVDSNPGLVYSQASAFLADVEYAREATLIRAARWTAGTGLPRVRCESRKIKSIGDFHRDERYGGDLNRADLAYCVYALSNGISEGAIRAALQERDLSKKGSPTRVADYIRRTIVKAAEFITSNLLRPTAHDRERELSR
jgi:hypothetical protein